MNVYTIIDKVPEGTNIITTRWVLKHKKDSNGNIVTRKARLVARGFSQVEGLDYIDTFSPTLRQDTFRIFISIAVQNKYDLHQMDIKAAYLNADLEEDIYMEIPEGESKRGYCKLNKALYGLKQAGRMWNNTLNEALIKLKFIRFKSDPCFYIKRDKNNNIVCMLAVYVDDIVIAGNIKEINETKYLIMNKFKAKDIGEVDFIIGIKFKKCEDGYIIHQKGYLEDIFNKFEIHKYTPTTNTIPIEYKDLREKKFDSTMYR